MLKVPATEEGFAAVEELLSEGMNVNVTLIFSLEQYQKTARAYLRGLERLSRAGADISAVRSVASVFVSRVDTVVDTLLSQELFSAGRGSHRAALTGRAAVANCNLIFEQYRIIFSSETFCQLQKKGAHTQRVLWGSTSTKNPAYRDIKYVSELIGRDTVNTIPENTLEAFLDHGDVKEALTPDARPAREIIDTLKEAEIDIDAVCRQLLTDGVRAFEKSFESLLRAIEKKAHV